MQLRENEVSRPASHYKIPISASWSGFFFCGPYLSLANVKSLMRQLHSLDFVLPVDLFSGVILTT